MSDKAKTKDQLIAELEAIRQRVTDLEALEADHKRAETALRETEAKYRTLVEQLPAITYTVEFFKDASRTTYISPQVETLLGFSQVEWLTDRNLWVNQLHPADRDYVLAKVTRSNALGEPLDLEYRSLARDGRVVWFRNRQTMLIQDETGKPRLIHGVMFDITEQKKLEEQLIQAQKMEAVGQMAGGISHNFNNVLTALIGHTELAIMQLSSDHPAYGDLKAIRKNAQRAAKLTQQLLAFTRHQVTYPIVVSLNNVVLNMDSILHQLIGESIELVMSLEPELWRVKVDAAQMEQALVNLVVNARDAMPSGGKLTIESTNITLDSNYVSQYTGVHPGDYVMLAISDTGTGMSKEITEHIFEPFFTTKEVDKGTGLGLSACYGIVKQSGGHIMVYSEPSQGTTFKVYLPRFLAKASENSLAREESHSPTTRNQIILLVEDEPVVRELAVRILNQQGYTVLEAANGEDALNIVQTQPERQLHLLITDISMPRIGGDVLAKQLVVMYPNLKVLFMSGYTDKAIVHRGIIDENVAILSKPFTPSALIDKVHTILSGEDN